MTAASFEGNTIKREEFTFSCLGRDLSATKIVTSQPCQVLMLHGGGEAASKRYETLANQLALYAGISSLRFDHCGWGQSTGSRTETSLAERTQEALKAYEYLDDTKSIIVFGTSMGGHTALDLLGKLPVSHLILSSPGLFPDEAHAVQFGPAFTDILHQDNNFADSSLLENLRQYRGGILHFIGTEDEIIPPEITDLYMDNAINVRTAEFLDIDGAPHSLYKWFEQNPAQEGALIQAIAEFIQS